MRTYIFLFVCFFLSCVSISNRNDLEEAYLNSENYLESTDLELDKWFELDSIFNFERNKFEKNIADYKVETKAYNQSLIDDYSSLSSEFYKIYLISKLEKLEVFLQDVDFDSASEKVSEIFSELYDEFYELNSKMTKDDRVEIAERIGEFSAKYFKKSFDFLSEEFVKGIEDFSRNFEDFSKSLESTIENLFKE